MFSDVRNVRKFRGGFMNIYDTEGDLVKVEGFFDGTKTPTADGWWYKDGRAVAWLKDGYVFTVTLPCRCLGQVVVG